MSAPAYLALLSQPSVAWILLAEVQVRQALRGWTSEGSGAYSVPIRLSTHPSAVRPDLGLYLGLNAVWEGVTALTLQASVAAVKANAGSYFYDAATATLYVRSVGTVNPDTLSLVQWGGTVRVSTSPFCPTDQPPYDAQIDASSVPSIEASRPDLLRGISAFPSGNLSLANADGFWDYLCDITPAANWLWINNTVRLLLGADGLAYADFEPLALMQLPAPPKCGDAVATLPLRSISNALKTSFPRHTLGDFYGPSIAVGGGTPSASLPMWWGSVADAPLVFVGDNGLRNKWVSGDMFYLSAVTYASVSAIDRSTGVRTLLTGGGVDYFILGGGDKAIDISKTYDPATYDIVADVSQAATTCGSVALAILTACGIPSALIDAATFSQADADNPAVVGLWAGLPPGLLTAADALGALTSGADLLDRVTRSTFCQVVLSPAGQWTASVWDPSFDLASLPMLTDDDLLACDPAPSVPVLSTGVKVKYGQKVYGGTWSETTSSPGAASFEQNTDEANTVSVESALATATDAVAHAQRLALIDSRPKLQIQIKTGPRLMNLSVGDKVRIARDRGPSTSGVFDAVMEIESHSKTLRDLLVAAAVGNQRGLGELVKRVAPDGTPDWATASADARRSYGFAADDTTRMVDTTDRATYLQGVSW